MITRRQVLQSVSALGIGSTVFGRALAQESAGKPRLTGEMISSAQWVSGIELNEEQRNGLMDHVNSLQNQLEQLRNFELDPQGDPPALAMRTLVPQTTEAVEDAPPLNSSGQHDKAVERPSNDEDLAFLSVHELAFLIKSRKVSSVELTELYLDRLKRFDPQLLCVVTLTENLAMELAKRADQELAAGKYRGPLHGIPWGAKDLIAVDGYPTTWGLPAFESRVLRPTATVASRLLEAGAVLVAKLSLGAIAMGDKWFKGSTRNPWNLNEGSSGSSAGSCCASSAGLVAFALGSETLGSILTPSARCASHGLRPTLGRISRAGCMPLSWSMDKIGPIGRSMEDLAMVFQAIQGPDGIDASVVEHPFHWPARPIDLSQLTIGVIHRDKPDPALAVIRQMGCRIKEIELPTGFPFQALTKIIDIEGAAVFDSMLKRGETQGWNSWTKSFQTAQFISAIDYLRMQRVRRKLMVEFEQVIRSVDILLNAGDLVHTNFTGHPSVTVPFVAEDAEPTAKPTNVVFTGQLFGEEKLLAIASEFEKRRPRLPRPKL